MKYKHGFKGTRIYTIWCLIKQRIFNQKVKEYKNYGGRGITICPEWTDKDNGFINFKDWALNNGYADDLVIDRKNTDGNYNSSNCRWITKLESNRNKRNTITLEIANKIRDLHKTGDYTQKELSEKYNISRRTIGFIINNKQWKN